MKVQLNDIRAITTGKEPKNHSPRFDYCRKLLQQGVDPNEPLEVYRGDTLSMTIRSIGEGAKLAIRENEKTGPRFIKYQPFTTWDRKVEPTTASSDTVEAIG
jgi:Fe2+ transport system protein FeoA